VFHLLSLLASVLGFLAVVNLIRADESPAAGVIRVQVVGHLVTVGQRSAGAKEWTITGYVHAEGRDLLLDCSSSAAAQKLLQREHGEPERRIFTSSTLPVRIVQVQGRLKFRPTAKAEGKGKRAGRTDTVPVIVVESLKIVE
jgi:hypothetical protein